MNNPLLFVTQKIIQTENLPRLVGLAWHLLGTIGLAQRMMSQQMRWDNVHLLRQRVVRIWDFGDARCGDSPNMMLTVENWLFDAVSTENSLKQVGLKMRYPLVNIHNLRHWKWPSRNSGFTQLQNAGSFHSFLGQFTRPGSRVPLGASWTVIGRSSLLATASHWIATMMYYVM